RHAPPTHLPPARRAVSAGIVFHRVNHGTAVLLFRDSYSEVFSFRLLDFTQLRAEAASPFSMRCLKLRRYSSTLWERLGGSKIERILNVTSVSSWERGSKETTPDMKSLAMVRHAIRRPGICSTMWKIPCCSSPLGCHV